MFKPLRGVVAAADAVLPATDPDREGEAIAWHLANALELRMPRHSPRTGRPEGRPSIGSTSDGDVATSSAGSAFRRIGLYGPVAGASRPRF